MVVIRSLCSFLAFSVYISNAIAERQCYALNGTQLGDEYGACNPDATHSGCCAINRTAGSADLCLSNGLCMATNNKYMGTIWQSGCTDPTGKDPSCPKVCPDVTRDNLNTKVPSWNVQTCDFGVYCCRAADDTSNCCNNATIPKIKTKSLGTLMFNTSTITNASTTTSTSTASPTSSTSASTASQLPAIATPSSTFPDESLSCAEEKRQTTIVGGTLAGIFSAVTLGLLAVILFLMQKEKKQRKLKEHYEEQFATSAWGKYASGVGSKSTVSADSAHDGTEKDVEVRYIGRRDT